MQPESVPAASDAGISRMAVLTDAAAIPAGRELPPGSSREQRDAERVMLDLLSQQLGSVPNPARLTVPSGERVEVDGADADLSVLVECWAHQGPPKSAQRHKVLADPRAVAIAPRPGPAPGCTDAELLAIALMRHLLGRRSEAGFLAEVARDWGHLFPVLPHQSEANRRIRWL